jgi:hypothetical protein
MKKISAAQFRCIAILFIIFGIYYFANTIIHWKINWTNYYYGHSNINTFEIVVDVLTHVVYGIAHSFYRIIEGLLILLIIKNRKIIMSNILN